MANVSNISSLPEDEIQVIGDAPSKICSSSVGERFKVESIGPGSRTKKKCCLSVTPVVVDFKRLLQLEGIRGTDVRGSPSVVEGMSNRDLLHAVVGLYDTCLSEMTPDVIYYTVCAKWAKTIVLVRDVKDVFLEFEKKRDESSSGSKQTVGSVSIAELKLPPSSPPPGEDKYSAAEPTASTFACCYSDSESEEEEGDDSDDEDEDYSKGIHKFLSEASLRRKSRHEHVGPFTLEQVGPENRIVAACTFDRKYMKNGEKIIHLTLVSIRKRFRRLGLGRYLVEKVKDARVTGSHDAVVVHAENEAAPFFSKYGFSDDVILNTRWREIAEQFTNCMLLSYIPPYSGQAVSDTVTDFDLVALDQELRKWKDRSIEAYQSQVTIIERMKAEMIRLRSMVSTQDDIITSLRSKLLVMETSKLRTENSLMLHKLKSLSVGTTDGEEPVEGDMLYENLRSEYQTRSSQLGNVTDVSNVEAPPKSPPPLLAISTEQELKRYMVIPKNSVEVYDHGKDIAEFHKICEDFKSSLRADLKPNNNYKVTSVTKALPNQSVVQRYSRMLKLVGETSKVAKLYFCSSRETPDRLKEILKSGFSDDDFVSGDYGRGLYFSRCASTALHFTTPNKVLVAEVIIGKCKTLVVTEKERRSPDTGYNSILCPGRLSVTIPTGDNAMATLQEYVIFNCSQLLPLDLIEFSTVTFSAATTSASSIPSDSVE